MKEQEIKWRNLTNNKHNQYHTCIKVESLSCFDEKRYTPKTVVTGDWLESSRGREAVVIQKINKQLSADMSAARLRNYKKQMCGTMV